MEQLELGQINQNKAAENLWARSFLICNPRRKGLLMIKLKRMRWKRNLERKEENSKASGIFARKSEGMSPF
jgi:hypothetical protein